MNTDNIRELIKIARILISADDHSGAVSSLASALEHKLGITLDMYYTKHGNAIILSRIVVKKENRSKGVGSTVMKEICAFADKNQLPIALTPSSDFGGTKSRLIQFYKSFGFVKNNDHTFRETMIRLPA